MFGLAHTSIEWLIAGPISVIGLCVFLGHLIRGEFLRFTLSVGAWVFFFSMHADKGVAGAMTATWAALLFDFFGLAYLSHTWKKHHN